MKGALAFLHKTLAVVFLSDGLFNGNTVRLTCLFSEGGLSSSGGKRNSF